MMNLWELNALVTAPYLLIRGLTSIFFINENASLPKATCGNSHPSIEREHLVFLSSLDESFDGNAATKRIFDCVTCCCVCVWRSIPGPTLRGGSAERAPNRFDPANKSLSLLLRRRKEGTNGQTTNEMGEKEGENDWSQYVQQHTHPI